jgi:putative Mn2+ efflux pump MntP
MLVTLSIATSIDALAVGGSMALLTEPAVNLGVALWMPCVVIGIVAGFLSMVGILFSSRIGSRWSRWAEMAGGVVLILIGLNILRSHLL